MNLHAALDFFPSLFYLVLLLPWGLGADTDYLESCLELFYFETTKNLQTSESGQFLLVGRSVAASKNYVDNTNQRLACANIDVLALTELSEHTG